MCTATTCAIATSADSRTHPSAPRYGLRGVGCLKQMPNAVFQQFDSPLPSAELSNPDYSVAELMLSWKKESHMRIGSVSNSLLILMAGGAASLILTAAPACAASCAKTDLVEFERMTWVEVKCEIAAGKTTALIYTGGVEQRGPHLANGGHNLIAHAVVEAIARKLGKPIYPPVLASTPN